MKKQFLGIVALVLAIVFSAFTPHKKDAAPNNVRQVDLYWYIYDQGNDKIVGTLIDYAEADEVKIGDCNQDSGAFECMRGYDSPLPAYQIGTSPAPSGDGHIYEEE